MRADLPGFYLNVLLLLHFSSLCILYYSFSVLIHVLFSYLIIFCILNSLLENGCEQHKWH
jgi:hypothetical protein